MKPLFFTLFSVLFAVYSSNAQVVINKDLRPDSASYSNIYVKTLHSDEKSSVYAIWVKEGVKLHKHEHHTEVITVLAGKGLMAVGESERKIRKGDVVIIPFGTPHEVRTTSRKPLKVISTQSPVFTGADRIWLTK